MKLEFGEVRSLRDSNIPRPFFVYKYCKLLIFREPPPSSCKWPAAEGTNLNIDSTGDLKNTSTHEETEKACQCIEQCENLQKEIILEALEEGKG